MRFSARITTSVLLTLLAQFSWAQSAGRSVSGGCEMINNPIYREKPGPIHRQTTTIMSPDKKLSAFADISFRLADPVPDAQGTPLPSCIVTYRLLMSDKTGKLREIKRYSENRWGFAGVTIGGFSPDGSKLAADFWWMPGDYTSLPRPVVADTASGSVKMRELGDRITNVLPGCDYTQNLTGVTNTGEAVIRIPSSRFPEPEGGGCSDQGAWLFNLTTGEVRRVASKPASQ